MEVVISKKAMHIYNAFANRVFNIVLILSKTMPSLRDWIRKNKTQEYWKESNSSFRGSGVRVFQFYGCCYLYGAQDNILTRLILGVFTKEINELVMKLGIN